MKVEEEAPPAPEFNNPAPAVEKAPKSFATASVQESKFPGESNS